MSSSRPRLQAQALSGLVGREREVEALEREMERARSGEFRAVLLVGDAGVGKTRLASELLARHQDDVVGLSARAYPLGATAAFGLWAEALEGHLRSLPGPELSRLCRGLLDDLAGLLRSVAVLRGSAPDREAPRLQLLEAIADLLVGLTRGGPVMVVLDDVQLADASSWELLGYLGRTLARAPLLVVMTARPDELAEPGGRPADRPLPSAGRPPPPHGRRDRSADRPSPASSTPFWGGDHPGALVTWLDDRSGGNALFALGLLRALLEEGADLEAPELRALPEDLAERVRARLGNLEPSAIALLELLAVLGRRVELGELVTLAGQIDRGPGGRPGAAGQPALHPGGGAGTGGHLRGHPPPHPGRHLRRDRGATPAYAAPPAGPEPAPRRTAGRGRVPLRPLCRDGRRRGDRVAPGCAAPGRGAGRLP